MADAKQALRDRLENDCRWHKPSETDGNHMTDMRQDFLELGLRIIGRCPISRELSLALTHLDQVLMYANAAIARNPSPPGPEPENPPKG